METSKSFQIGVNLGGWLSQYREYDHRHFQTFITAPDIEKIAGWGMDHVRLPIDYPVLEDDEKPFIYKDSGFDYIDQCLDWCQANNLGVVLDLHCAPGYSFDTSVANSLFNSPELEQRLIALWEAIARRYTGRRQPAIILELLNEIAIPSSGPWNDLAGRICKAIRAISPETWILIGGNEWNSASTLKDIELINDSHMLYTFHFYEPLPFTHQKAYWSEELKTFDQELAYPGWVTGLEEFLHQKPQYRDRLGRYAGTQMDKNFLRSDLQPAIDFIQNNSLPLYCGEFGVIEGAPRTGRLNWYKDYISLLKEFKIGRACWSYKLMDFGLVDQDGHVVDEELVRIVSS